MFAGIARKFFERSSDLYIHIYFTSERFPNILFYESTTYDKVSTTRRSDLQWVSFGTKMVSDWSVKYVIYFGISRKAFTFIAFLLSHIDTSVRYKFAPRKVLYWTQEEFCFFHIDSNHKTTIISYFIWRRHIFSYVIKSNNLFYIRHLLQNKEISSYQKTITQLEDRVMNHS